MSRWCLRGGVAALTASPPLSHTAEKKLILALTDELNSAFDLGLCTDLVLARTSEAILRARREIGFKKLIARRVIIVDLIDLFPVIVSSSREFILNKAE